MGYAHSGVGRRSRWAKAWSAIAARERTPIRIGHATAEYAYGRAIREAAERGGVQGCAEIPLPGLAEARSQIAVPIEAFGEVVGVLFADSPRDLRFWLRRRGRPGGARRPPGAAIRLCAASGA
jgi:adenylate cyclase